MSVTTTMKRCAAWQPVLCALSLALVVSLAPHASAAFMAPGATLIASPEPDPTGGLTIGSTGPLPFATASYSGTLDSTVLLGDPSNPFGGLTFTYLLTNDAVSTGEIARLTVNDYAGFLVDASFQTPAIGVPPSLMSRSGSGDVVGFSFIGTPIGAGVLTPGSSGALLVVQTNATLFAPTLASVIDGQVTMVGSFAPVVPEPCCVVLIGFGIAAALLRRRVR